jgi:hypothetical protein
MFFPFNESDGAMDLSSTSSSHDRAGNTPQSQVKLLSIRRKIVNLGSLETMSILNLERLEFPRAWIACSITALSANCLKGCKTIQLLAFESNSRLNRIESFAFSSSSLRSIEIPRNGEILGSSCFSACQSFSSLLCRSNSRLTRIESSDFSSS